MKRVKPWIECHKRGKDSYAPLQRVRRGLCLLKIWSIHMNSISFTLRAQSFSETLACTDLFLHFFLVFYFYLLLFLCFTNFFLTKLDLQSVSQGSLCVFFFSSWINQDFIAIIQMCRSFFFFFSPVLKHHILVLVSFWILSSHIQRRQF